ncbi:hypothetical protein BS50DRAFT_663112 [Corynespora cassiicola Philippines]|uniref:Tautomerase cis-CaaD-like domain-containing protein n=1 Tax=Corynespora cassiicola Philippines TaxID=1448308 RepID=A0A2T2NT07_CORCC|nr:hypothetical protein BS50DRAFT_663112 [Corynespora cassiicola Philippines]
MPLWHIYHPPTLFTDPAEREALSKDITEIYAKTPLPRFYVVVLFVPIEPSNMYVGGVSRPSVPKQENKPGPDSAKPFVRITIQNIARKVSTPEAIASFLSRVDAAIHPHIAAKSIDWEYSVVESSRDLWKINGLVPPLPNTPAERRWVEENVPTPYESEEGLLGN